MFKRSATKILKSALLVKYNRLVLFADFIYTIVEILKRPWRHLALGHLQFCWGSDVERLGCWNWWVVSERSCIQGCIPRVLCGASLSGSFCIRILFGNFLPSWHSQVWRIKRVSGVYYVITLQKVQFVLQPIMGMRLIQSRIFKAESPFTVIKMVLNRCLSDQTQQVPHDQALTSCTPY